MLIKNITVPEFIAKCQEVMGGRYYRNPLREFLEFPLIPLINRKGWDQPYYQEWEIILNGLKDKEVSPSVYDLDEWKLTYLVDGITDEASYLDMFSEKRNFIFVAKLIRENSSLKKLEELAGSDKISQVHLETTRQNLNFIAGGDDWNTIEILINSPACFFL